MSVISVQQKCTLAAPRPKHGGLSAWEIVSAQRRSQKEPIAYRLGFKSLCFAQLHIMRYFHFALPCVVLYDLNPYHLSCLGGSVGRVLHQLVERSA